MEENKIVNKYVERLYGISPEERKKRFGEEDLFFDGGNLILKNEGRNNQHIIELSVEELKELKEILN